MMFRAWAQTFPKRMCRHEEDDAGRRRQWLSPRLRPRRAPRRRRPPRRAADARCLDQVKVWIGRYGEFEEYLKTAPVVRIREVGIGVTHPRRAFFAPGGLASSAS